MRLTPKSQDLAVWLKAFFQTYLTDIISVQKSLSLLKCLQVFLSVIFLPDIWHVKMNQPGLMEEWTKTWAQEFRKQVFPMLVSPPETWQEKIN